ncbi:TetR/AcrR family transcriptional regulator [Phenylobacterium sp.]|uniref:TetR/AcrR family transcriptional regulator n=1 Tax=Phenylobacterium sp. TaxID=1871053 RepID=UPI0025EA3D8D|nr:TetR/AcrR family transcriptional regulator [Phenylobacterium sp.]
MEPFDLTGVDGVMPANQARSREAQARLLKAGEEVFARKGYDEAHVGDIAAAAGCSIGSFYRRFRDKEALFRALHLQFAHRIERNMERFLSRPERAGQPVYEVLEVLVRNTAQVIERHPGFFRALFQRMLAGAGRLYVPALWAADTASGLRLAAFLRSRGEGLPDALDDACALGLRSVEAILIQRVLRRDVVQQEAVAPPFVIDRLTRMLAACIGVTAPPERRSARFTEA